jgi:ArsR family transcriptional regulator
MSPALPAPKTKFATIEALPLVDAMQMCCPDLMGTDVISEDDAQIAARVFKALGDPARVRLLSMISAASDEGACVCDLIAPLGLAQPTVSHHLKVLLDAGLLERERRGSWAFYRLRRDAVAAIASALGA